jgi:hypothetical protein
MRHQPLPALLAPALMRGIDASTNVGMQIAPFGEFETEGGNLVQEVRRRPQNRLIRRLVVAVGKIIALGIGAWISRPIASASSAASWRHGIG